MEYSHSELDEDETPEVDERIEPSKAPPGWRPSAETVAAIASESDAPSDSEWVDRGIQDVPLDTIDISDSPVEGEEDFRKVSHDDMVEGFSKLEKVVRPAVEQGADGDTFYQMDQVQGLDYEHGYQRIYDSFYGTDAIRLNRDGERTTVVNGYHRLQVARELGIKTVPARVIERRR
jgi:hypothetical protein